MERDDPQLSVGDAELRPFFTVAALAKRLAISERTVRDILNRGELEWYRIGSQRRIDPADVDRWLAERKHQAS